MPKYNKVETTPTAKKSNLFKNKYEAEKQNIKFYFILYSFIYYDLSTS